MKLFDSFGPNPHTTRLFALERGCVLDIHPMDIMSLENRREPYVSEVNTRGEMPALLLDNGQVITEITAICEYLDDVTPGRSLFGTTPETRANVRMWTRRVYLGICHPAIESWRGTDEAENFYCGNRIVIPEAKRSFRFMTESNLNWLEKEMNDKSYIAGDTYSMADVILFAFMDDMLRVANGYCKWVNTPSRPNIAAWYERILARPSSEIALYPLPAGPLQNK